MRAIVPGIAFISLALGYETACNDFRDKKIEYLDRHFVNCPPGNGLKHWTFTTCGGDNFKASYGCNAIPGRTGILSVRKTGCTPLNDHNLEFLDRQNLACVEGEVMEGFRLHRDGCGGNDMQFSVYCRQYDVSSSYVAHARGSGCNEIDGKRLEFLDRHVPDCGADFMSQWYMTRSGCSGNHQRIAATCLTLSQPTCDYNCYLHRYVDLQNAFGANTVAAMNHYRDHGRGEGRDCTCPQPVDCVGAWSGCDANCEKTYAVTTAAAHGGAECPVADGAVDAESCAAGDGDCPSPVDCVGAWEPCTAECEKTFRVISPAEHGGTCEATDFQTADCAQGEGDCPLPVDCVGSWEPCTAECQKTFRVIAPAEHGGTCEATDLQTADCAPGEGDCPLPPIDTMDKLKAWCSESVDNCKVCKGKDEDDGSCKVNENKILKCKLYKKNNVCGRIVGCKLQFNEKKEKTNCKGKASLE